MRPPSAPGRARRDRRTSTAGRLVRWSLAGLVAVLLGGCVSGSGGPAPPTTPAGGTTGGAPSGPLRTAALEWKRLAVPGQGEPVVLAADRGTVLIGAYRAGQPPSLARLRPDTSQSPTAEVEALLPLRVTWDPSSPYAPLARWHSIALRDGVITAIGGAAGGAHSNTRWTTWSGELAPGEGPSGGGLQERPQSFYAFGGYGAGELLDAVATSAGRFLVGSWDGTTGLDAAVWHEEGKRWVRAPSAGTALASTPTALVGVAGAASTGPGILVTGSVTHLGGEAGVRRAAAVWQSTRGASGWRRVDLPGAGSRSEARSATCAPDGCVVAGLVEGRYALWWLPASGAPVRLDSTPDVAVTERDPLPAPIRTGAQHVRPGADLVVAAGATVAARVAGSWLTVKAPGPVRDAAAAGGEVLLVTGPTGAGATPALWRGRMAAP